MKKLVVLLFLGLVIRLFFIPQPGFAADIAYWKSWSLAAAEKGIVWTTLETNYNYAPAFLYFLKAVGWLAGLTANANQFQTFWQETNLPYLVIIKLPVILADLLTAVGLWWLIKNQNQSEKPALLAAAYYLFNPFIIFNGAYWGQVGSIGTGLIFLSLILLFKNKPVWSIGVATLAFLLKLQMIFYLPLLLLWTLKKHGWQKFVLCLGAAVAVFMAVSFPFLLRHRMDKPISLILSSADYFPYLSLNAYNLWWLVAKGAGFVTSDRILIFGTTNAKFLSLFAFLVFYLLAILLLAQKTKKTTLFKACLWIAFAFFMLPTQMHERYIYPAFLFLALLLPTILKSPAAKKRPISTYFYILLLILLAITGFYNLHNALIVNYPGYGLPLISRLNFNSLTVATAAIHLLLFGGLSWLFLSQMDRRLSFSVLGLAVALLVTKQASFVFAAQIPLTKIDPIVRYQEYSLPMKNLTTNSAWGPKRWAFLSTNYYFYRTGIGSHASSRLVYPLKGQFKRFETDVAIDTQAGLGASVEFKIYGDNRLLYQSGVVKKFDPPQHVVVEIASVNQLTLEITDADDGNTDDHADWLKPVLYK